MKLAVVVQRYGADINGGAELHARYIAERLSRHAQVEVLTTCAKNYVSWRNERPPGVANRASSAATTRSQEATSWHPAAVAMPCTSAMTGCGMFWMVSMRAVQASNSSR